MAWKTRLAVSVLVAVAALCRGHPAAARGGPPPRPTPPSSARTCSCSIRACRPPTSRRPPTDIFSKMEANEFGPERYALLFKPGKYDVTFNVGFYTHVAGLGRNPDDVHINGGVNVPADWMPNANATCNFWRSLENFAVTPSSTKGVTRIAVSQAAPLRRLHVKGELHLFAFDKNWNAGWASGGFLADSVVDGKVVPASQQQWLSRNSKWSRWTNAVWNTVFVGCVNTPEGAFPNPAYTVVDRTPDHPGEAVPLRRWLGRVPRLRPGAEDRHPGRQLARRPDARRVDPHRPVLHRTARDRKRPEHQRRAGRRQARPVHSRRLFAGRHASGSPGPTPSSSASASPRWSRRRACRSSRWPTWTG